MNKQLPCYRLVATGDAGQRIDKIARELFGFEKFTIEHDPAGRIHTARETGSSREVELDERLGTIWMADWERLWNPAITPRLLGKDEAAQKAMAFFCKHDLLPSPHALPEIEIVIGSPLSTHTVRTAPDGDGLINLDTHVGVPVDIRLDGHEIGRLVGRDKWCITFGEDGRIINCVLGRLVMQPQVSLDHSDILLPPALPVTPADGDRTSVSLSLGYERLRDIEGKEWLLPMYFLTDDSRERPRFQRFPATERSESVLDGLIAAARASLQPSIPDGQTLASVRAGLLQNQRFAASWTIDANEPSSVRVVQTQGLLDGLTAQGWKTVPLLEGEAREEHWSARRDLFVQQVDFAYYCGHASQSAWMLSTPAADGQVNSDEVNDPKNPIRYGKPFVNWIGLAACGPLQDPATTKKADSRAVPRWRNLFDGLLGFCGFAATSVPHPDMGEVLARALTTRSVPRAWFRAGRECQPLVVSTTETDRFSIWMATLTCDGAHPTFDLTIGDGRRGTPRSEPANVMAMWTPV